MQIIALEWFYQIIKYTVHFDQLCETKIVLEMCRLINICANAEQIWNFSQECEKQVFTYVFPILFETIIS